MSTLAAALLEAALVIPIAVRFGIAIGELRERDRHESREQQ